MQKTIIFILFCISTAIFSLESDAIRVKPLSCVDSQFPTVTSWVQACKKMPKNRDTKILVNSSKHSPFFETVENFLDKLKDILGLKNIHQQASKEYLYILDLWKNMVVTGPLSQENLWALSNTGKQKPNTAFYDIQKLLKPDDFQPYVQKLLAKSDDQFYVHGDLHGDIHSLIIELEFLLKEGIIDENFRITTDNVWFLFLGDYVDRGKYGSEVIYTLLRLSLANQERVILVRGNHEEDKVCNSYGFKAEVMQKFEDSDLYSAIVRMYDFLPVVLYLGIENKDKNIINYIQCCHGGLEVGYDPKYFLDDIKSSYQLVGKLYSSELLKKCDECLSAKDLLYASNTMSDVHRYRHPGFVNYYQPLDTISLGFLWTDFNVLDTKIASYNKGRGFEYGSKATQTVLELQSSEHSKIRGIIRAHQHSQNPGDFMMESLIRNKGVYKLWKTDEISLSRTFKDGLVWTFNVSPDTVYGKNHEYDFHAFAKITLQKNYDDWQMQVFNLTV
jgi:hypothetical protein